MTNDYSFYSINSKIYEKELRYNETLLQQTTFTSPLALVCYGGSSVVEYLPIIFCPGSYTGLEINFFVREPAGD